MMDEHATPMKKMSSDVIRNVVLTAAKRVCDDPNIEFDTVEGAKEALNEELNRILNEYFYEPAKTLSEITDASTLIDPGNFLFDLVGDPLRFDSDMFKRELELIDEACVACGIPKSKDGGYVLKGDDLKKVADYINQKREKV